MMDLKECHKLYLNDPEFHRVVVVLAGWIERMEVSPSEVRAAAMFACYLVQARHPQITFEIKPGDLAGFPGVPIEPEGA
jgi:hypothetical protein